MPTDIDHITGLILKFHRGMLSIAEQRELEQWVAGADGRGTLFEALTDERIIREQLEKMDQFSEERVRASIEARRPNALSPVVTADYPPAMGDGKRGEVVRIFGRRAAVAAAILLLMVTGGYFWYRAQPTVVKGVVVKNDVLPGGDKAILTLAGGQRIILDSVHQGLLAQQGNAQVSKTDSGRLVYRSGGGGVAAAPVYNTLSTPRGGQYQLILPDGTKVWLNAASSITYPTSFIAERSISITGEAYFEVAQDPGRPFKVKVNDMTVTVLGTSFNINAYNDEPGMRTTLLTGAIAVNTRGGRSVVRPGQQTLVKVNGDAIDIVDHADVEQAVAWKDGRFSFHEADLPTVMRQLARWYDVDITYEGDIPPRRFSGRIGKTLTLDQVLKILTHTRVHYSIEAGNRLIIRP